MPNSNSKKISLLVLIQYGGYVGLTMALTHLVFYQLGWIWTMWAPPILVLLTSLQYLVMGGLTMYLVKKNFRNYYPFRKNFAYILFIFFIATLIMVSHDLLFHLYIEPNFDLTYIEGVKANFLAMKDDMIKNNKILPEEVTEILKNMDAGIKNVKDYPSTFMSIVLARLTRSFILTMISGVVIAIFFRDPLDYADFYDNLNNVPVSDEKK